MEEEKMIVSLRQQPAQRPHPPSEHLARPSARRRKRTRVVAVVIVLAALIAGAAFALLHRAGHGSENGAAAGQASSTVAESQAQAASQTDAIIAEVGKLIELPQGETPTVATVSDPSKLKDQSFFANAKTGDIVLLYTTAREAYLYDPVENKLVEVAPITTGATPQQ
jgi:hypothetical protein